MALAPIDVLVPGLEGEWLVRALLDAGIPARRRVAASAVPPDPAPRLLVLGLGPEEDPVAALEELRRGGVGATEPILLVGGAPLDLGAASRHGVVAMLDRPASVARMLAEVERLLARGSDRGHEASVVLRQAERFRRVESAPSPPTRTQVLEAEDRADEGRPSTDAPPPRLSEGLVELLRAADRRLFPDDPDLDLRFAGADDAVSAAELVPDEMLYAPASSGKGGDLDPVDDPTFLGEPALLAGDSAALRTPSAPALPDTSPDRPESVRPETGGSEGPPRRTSWPPPREVFSERMDRGGGLRALWEICQRPGTWSLVLASPDAPRIELTLRDGHIVAFDGPAWAEVAARVGHVLLPASAERVEVEARRSLEARVEDGTLSGYVLDATLRGVRETLTSRVLTASGLACEARSGEDLAEAGRPVFARDALGLLFEAARRRLTAPQVEAWLGGAGVGLSLTNTTLPRLVAARVEPELFAFLERHQGEALGGVLRRLDPSVGLPGVVFALHVTAALDVLPAGGRPKRVEADHAEALLRASYQLALGADYFTILGLAPPASAREVHSAYASRREALAALALPNAGLPHLERVRGEVLDALEEARAVLADDRLREAYAAALAPPS